MLKYQHKYSSYLSFLSLIIMFRIHDYLHMQSKTKSLQTLNMFAVSLCQFVFSDWRKRHYQMIRMASGGSEKLLVRIGATRDEDVVEIGRR